MEKNIDSFVESLNSKSSLEKIKELESEVIDLKRELDSIKEEPSKLTKLTQDFLSNSSEDAQQQRVNLIDKTNQFADLQAKFAALTSEDKLANSHLEALELENLSLIDELKALEDPISEIQSNLDALLSERLVVENKLLESRKAIELCNESIHKMEREKIEKEQMQLICVKH